MSRTQILRLLVHDFYSPETSVNVSSLHPAKQSHTMSHKWRHTESRRHKMCTHASHMSTSCLSSPCVLSHTYPQLSSTQKTPVLPLDTHLEAEVLLTATFTGQLLVTFIVACMFPNLCKTVPSSSSVSLTKYLRFVP